MLKESGGGRDVIHWKQVCVRGFLEEAALVQDSEG